MPENWNLLDPLCDNSFGQSPTIGLVRLDASEDASGSLLADSISGKSHSCQVTSDGQLAPRMRTSERRVVIPPSRRSGIR